MTETNEERRVFFTEKEALESIQKFLEDDTTNYYVSELHDYIFNQDYYIIETYLAEKALNQYGVWDALEEIKDYEELEFGEVNTNFSSPVDVANMLEYIIGDKVINSLKSINKYYDNNLNDESNEGGKTVRQVIIDEIKFNIKGL